MRLRTVVGQLSIVDGAWREGAPNLGVAEPAFRIPLRRDRGNLYVVIEATGDPLGRDEAYEGMMEAIKESYFGVSGSVTLGLSQAIEAANSYLFRENMNSPRDMRRIAGLTCAVLKGRDLYLGQAGPALAYVIHKGVLERFPSYSQWLDEPLTEGVGAHPSPLGVEKRVEEIDLFHCIVEAGDLILLSSSSLARLAEGEEIAAMASEGVDVTIENLTNLAAGRDLSAIVIVLPAAEEELKPRVEEAVSEGGGIARMATAAREMVPRLDLAGFFGRIGRGVMGALAALTRGLGTIARRTLPEAEARPARAPAKPARKKLLIGVALAIPVLVAAIVAAVYLQQQREREAEFTQLIEQAVQRREQALALPDTDKAAKRGLLIEADGLLAEARYLKPEAPEVRLLSDKIGAELDGINAVKRLELSKLMEFPEAGSEPGRVLVSSIDVYVLDRGLNRVYKYLFNEAKDAFQALEVSPILLCQGDQRGDIVVGELIDMVWMEASGERKTSGLLTLESGGSLLDYDPWRGSIAVLPVADSRGWRWPRLVGSYSGNFYLLDSQLNQILKYVPTADGYSAGPIDWLKPETEVDLGGAMDMAIDGYVYVLLADGTILKFSGGERMPFEQTELDKPLRSPTAIFAAVETKHLYVADAGNERIVQFSKEGEFERQFRPKDALDQLRSLFVDEAKGRLYIVSGKVLYMANIPSEG